MMNFKKIIITTLVFILSLNIEAKDCTSNWPYLYPEFQKASVTMQGGHKYMYNANIHLLESTLHYLERNYTCEAVTSKIISVEIGNDKFINIDNKLMRVSERDNDILILELNIIDKTTLNETGGAYGSSSNSSSVNKLTSLTIPGVNVNHMEIHAKKLEGKSLSVLTKLYLYYKGSAIYASKSNISKMLTKDKNKDFKRFLKNNIIDFKDAKSLIKLSQFLK